MHNQNAVITIGKKTFLNVVYILLGLMLAAGILSLLIPKGMYERTADGTVLPDSFVFLDNVSYPFWRWFTAPIEVLYGPDAINVMMIGLFLLILGGTFTLMDHTGGMRVLIERLIKRFKNNKYALLRWVILVFMVFGAFFGIFEESLAMLPILILLSLSLGWDSMTGLGMCLLAAGFGFATAITNPFTIGVASTLAGTKILSGALYRLLIFVLMYGILQFFMIRYVKKIEADPKASLSYDADLMKNRQLDFNQSLPYDNEPLIFKSYVWLFVVLLFGILLTGILELFFSLSIPAIPVMALIFLIGGLLTGYVVSKDLRFTLKTFGKGMAGVAPAFVLIILAVSVKHIITEAMVMDTILYELASFLSGASPLIALLFIYLLVLVIQFFIGSASAKAFLIIPILIPLVALIGLSKESAILAFIFADGYTNVIFPTNAVLLIGLSIARVSYQAWFKFTIKLQGLVFIMTILLLMIAYWIGY